MATLAEDLAYFLVNPSQPYFVEGEKLINFYGRDGFIDFLVNAEPSLINHPDIVALGVPNRWNAETVWNLVRNQTAFGVEFREITSVDPCAPCAKMFVAFKPN
jgi:hypothetical protein